MFQIANQIFTVKVLPSVDANEFNVLYDMLEKISIPNKTNTNNRRGFPRHRATIFGITKGRFNGITGLSYFTKKYPEIYKELLRIGNLICPFEFKSIYLNKNTICPKHKDEKNVGDSLLVSFGSYTGANIVIDETTYNANCCPIVFNGSQLEHYNTDDLVGTKYSLIFFNSNF